MSQLEPIDNGVRRYRPGLAVLLTIPLLLLAVWLVVAKVREKQRQPQNASPSETIKEEVEKARAEKPIPNDHPLSGARRLFLADGSLFRYQELTFTRFFSTQHSHPGIVIKNNDPTLWNFVPVTDKKNVYRIYCADPNFPELHRHNLTYTRLVDDDEVLDDQPPYLTLRPDDYCEWKVNPYRPESHQNQYEIFCMSGDPPFKGKSLGWMTGQEDLQGEYVTPTLDQNGIPGWWILPEGETPQLPRRVSHLLVMNKGDIEHLDKAREDFTEEGHGIFEVYLYTANDRFTRSAENLDYVALVKSLRGTDPVLSHPDFPPIIGFNPNELLKQGIELKRPDPLFPLVIPLKVKLFAHEIRELAFENDEFTWDDNWEELEDLQSHLDESDAADGRIYHGEKFTYIFVAWDQ